MYNQMTIENNDEPIGHSIDRRNILELAGMTFLGTRVMPNTVAGQEDISVSVSPTSVDLDKGDSTTITVTVSNSGDRELSPVVVVAALKGDVTFPITSDELNWEGYEISNISNSQDWDWSIQPTSGSWGASTKNTDFYPIPPDSMSSTSFDITVLPEAEVGRYVIDIMVGLTEFVSGEGADGASFINRAKGTVEIQVQSDLPSSFVQATDGKRSIASEIDELAVYLSEEEDVRQLLDTYEDMLQNDEFENEQVPTNAIRRLISGETISKSLLEVTTESDEPGTRQQLAIRTTEFGLKFGVALALTQLELSKIAGNSQYSQLVPDTQRLQDVMDGAFDDLVSFVFGNVISANIDIGETIKEIAADVYADDLIDEYESADAFSDAIDDSIAATIADLGLQRSIETGEGVTLLGSQLSVSVVDQFANIDSSLSYLHEQLSPEAVRETGLAGTDEGMLEAERIARNQIDYLAENISFFLDELEDNLGFFSIIDAIFAVNKGITLQEGALRVAALLSTLAFKAGLAAAAVRGIGTAVGSYALRVLLTLHAYGIRGVVAGDPIPVDDVVNSLPDPESVIDDISEATTPWNTEFDFGVGDVV